MEEVSVGVESDCSRVVAESAGREICLRREWVLVGSIGGSVLLW